MRDAGPRRGGPDIGFSFEGRPIELLEAVCPFVDVIEIVPDCLVNSSAGALDLRWLDVLDEHPTVDVVYHGVGLSLGTASGWNEAYLELLELVCEVKAPRWHSEHLGFTTVDGHFLGTMPALPATIEAADLAIERVAMLQERFGIEVLLEHVASPLPRPDVMSRAHFLNVITRGSACGLILDLHNLECDADNGELLVDDFLDELDLDAVREIHVAGGVWERGVHLDVHAGLPAPSTRALLRRVAPHCRNLELVVFELLAEACTNFPASSIVNELIGIGLITGRVDAA